MERGAAGLAHAYISEQLYGIKRDSNGELPAIRIPRCGKRPARLPPSPACSGDAAGTESDQMILYAQPARGKARLCLLQSGIEWIFDHLFPPGPVPGGPRSGLPAQPAPPAVHHFPAGFSAFSGTCFPRRPGCSPPGTSETPSPRSLPQTVSEEMEFGSRATHPPGRAARTKKSFSNAAIPVFVRPVRGQTVRSSFLLPLPWLKYPGSIKYSAG